MILGSIFLIILYLVFRYIIAWINYFNNLDSRLGDSTWRFTYDYPVAGEMYMCLGQNDYVDFREILRTDRGDEYIKDKIRFALSIKPKRHDFIINSEVKPYISRHMNETGG